MEAFEYFANYVVFDYDAEIAPDAYVPGKKGDPPPSDFVVSKSLSGEVLSMYGDDVWDLRPYRLSGDSGNGRIWFSSFKNKNAEEIKWILFILMFICEPERSNSLSISSLIGYAKPLRILASYCDESNLRIRDVLEDEKRFKVFVRTLSTRHALKGLSAILAHLLAIPSEITNYKILSTYKVETDRSMQSENEEAKQHPVIPARIYSELIAQLDGFIDDFYAHKDSFYSFLDNIMRCDRYARSLALQHKLGYSGSELKTTFGGAAREHELTDYFAKYGVSNMPSLSKFLARLQHCTRLIIHIYTGMRSSEALSLTIGALSVEGGVYKVAGTTSKFVGQEKPTHWITSQEVERAHEIAESLAKFIALKLGLPEKDFPLFASTGYLSLFNKQEYDGVSLTRGFAAVKSQEIYNLLDENKFKVSDDDLAELGSISPFRAWESEKAFSIGQVWRFTIHQFRRTLAYYVAQSALVSLPSLKRQLKHVSREMTIYYCQANDLGKEFTGEGHIATLINSEKPEADAAAYVREVFNAAEDLYGAHGVYVERRKAGDQGLNGVAEDRDDLVRQFKAGQIAYSETALGACTKVGPCNDKLTRSLTSCLSCPSSVIKPSKLDRVIARQEKFVEELQRESHYVESRTEQDVLRELVAYKRRMNAGGGEA